MARTPAPRWYESRKAWYVELGGKQYLLAKGKANKAEATAAFHRLMIDGANPARQDDLSVEAMIDLFTVAIESKVQPVTLDGYQRRLQSFIDAYGKSKASDVRPLHIQRWLDKHPGWNDSTRFGYVAAVKRAFSWATKQGHLDRNPVEGMDRPTMGRKSKILTGEQYAKIVEFADVPRMRHFRDLLVGLWETGCRPAELVTLTADRVCLESRTWKVIDKIRRKTGEPTRLIRLTPVAADLSRKLLALRPEGLIFLNLRGRPWTRFAMSCNFEDIRRALGYGSEVTAYAFRHRYVTDALVGGMDVATVATLVGHKGVAMIMRHYSHLDAEDDYLRKAALSVRPGATPGADSASVAPEASPDRPPTPQEEPGTTRDSPPDPSA